MLQMCEEMMKLRQKLTDRGIVWKDASDITYIDASAKKDIIDNFSDIRVYRTLFEHNGYEYSVIYGYGTYGGFNAITGRDCKLLECMTDKVNCGEPIGSLTADDVIGIIEG